MRSKNPMQIFIITKIHKLNFPIYTTKHPVTKPNVKVIRHSETKLAEKIGNTGIVQTSFVAARLCTVWLATCPM